MRSKQSGFTLIELLVVIAIIGLLASIVMAALTNARGKAHDSAIISEAGELAKLMEFNNNDYGSYSNLQPSAWAVVNGTCAGIFTTGSYAAQATTVCNNMMKNETGNCTSNYCLYIGNSSANAAQSYSMMLWLPYMQKYYCLGSSGASSYVDFGDWGANKPGCYVSP